MVGMISIVRGKAVETEVDGAIVDVAGIGYRVFLTARTVSEVKLGSEVFFWTHLAVRENSLDLYGFREKEELIFFEMLVGISGIGPKSALGILNVASIKNMKKAISSGDTTYLTKVSGIGKKSADRIVVELQDKLPKFEESMTGELKEETDAVEALKALGYSTGEARDALSEVDEKIGGTADRVREALKNIGDN